VRCLCTSDDPVDDLHWHWQLQSLACPAVVLPTFRPDKSLNVHIPEAFNAWTEALAGAANLEIHTFTDFLEALRRRHDFFHSLGCRVSDHGLAVCPPVDGTEAEAAAAFQRARLGLAASGAQQQRFAGFLMRFFGRLDAEKGWTKQLHLGARRGNSTRGFLQSGPDSGYDSIGDWPQIDALGAYLDALERDNNLPKMVLYNLNPGDFYAFATMAGNFVGARGGEAAVAGRIQLRPAVALHRHADRLAQLHVVPAPRILPPRAGQPVGARHGAGAASGSRGAGRDHAAGHLLLQCPQLPGVVDLAWGKRGQPATG
jgi:glucuronate isomerase